MAEWLGSALQKLLQRFESASDLQIKNENPVNLELAGFYFLTALTSEEYNCHEIIVEIIQSQEVPYTPNSSSKYFS
jgi:hypothetical protein